MRIRSFILFVCLGCLPGLRLAGQVSANPFELEGRLPADQASTEPHEVRTDMPANPFDLERGAATQKRKPVKKNTPHTLGPSKRFVFFLTLFNLLFFSFISTLLRGYQAKAFRAFLAPNLLSQLYRERQVGVLAPFLIMYSFFFYNAAFFIFQHPDSLSLFGHKGLMTAFLSYLGAVMAVAIGKHLLLWIIGLIFPFQEVLGRYSFLIMVFYTMAGFYLAGANLAIAYGPQWLSDLTIYASLIILGLTLIYRHLRALLLTISLFAQHKFHFLLYICTVELVPFILLIKFLQIYF